MSLLAHLIATREGWGKPGAIPTTHFNPGDLRHANGETHAPGDPNGIGWFANLAKGWEGLEEQLQKFAGRDLTLEQAIYTFAPPTDHNDTENYLQFVCEGLGCDRTLSVADALKIGEPTGIVTA